MINSNKSNRGFTLLEVIVTIVVAAVLGSMLIAVMGTAVTKSAEPIVQAVDMASAESTLEKISADYAKYLMGSMTWNYIGPGYTVTITSWSTSNVTVSPTLSGLPNFEIKEIAATVGDQKLVSFYAR